MAPFRDHTRGGGAGGCRHLRWRQGRGVRRHGHVAIQASLYRGSPRLCAMDRAPGGSEPGVVLDSGRGRLGAVLAVVSAAATASSPTSESTRGRGSTCRRRITPTYPKAQIVPNRPKPHRTGPNCTKVTQLYQSHPTVPKPPNCTKATKLYQSHQTVPKPPNCTKATKPHCSTPNPAQHAFGISRCALPPAWPALSGPAPRARCACTGRNGMGGGHEAAGTAGTAGTLFNLSRFCVGHTVVMFGRGRPVGPARRLCGVGTRRAPGPA